MKTNVDFCTGRAVDFSKPEEQVRQETEQWLVNEMGYAKANIDIRVRVRVGSANLEADIVVYRCARGKNLDQQKDFLGIVEAKPKSMPNAERQLKTYMAASVSCEWGIAATREARQFYRRYPSGEIERIHTIPIAGKSIDQVSRLRKSDLTPAVNLKLRFKSILFHLYSNTNIQSRTRLCNEMTKILFCKIFDEKRESDIPIFQVPKKTSSTDVKQDIEEKLWKPALEGLTSTDVFARGEGLILDSDSIAYVVGELERVSLLETDCDVVGAAFEVFAERYFVGEKGEFFTPRVAVKNAIKIFDPDFAETVIDPACGSGGFLVQSLEHVWKKIKGTNEYTHRRNLAPNYIYGIDKEPDLVKVARSYMSLIGDGHTSIVDADSLKPMDYWKEHSRVLITNPDRSPMLFDLVFTNPPFGSNIKIEHDYILKNYELGHVWQRTNNLESPRWQKTSKLKPTSPQILFIERCFNFLKDNGRMCIVLPEGILANPTEGYVRQWLLDNMEILSIWDCPQALFLPHTNTKTCILFLKKSRVSRQQILMSHILKCGHDQRGAEIRNSAGLIDEDFSIAVEDWVIHQNGKEDFNLSSLVRHTDLDEEIRLIPRDHCLDTNVYQNEITLKELQIKELISIKTIPCDVKQSEYSITGIPFVRTSDFGVMEVRNTLKKVPLEVYHREREQQDIQPLDILSIKDGTLRIGESVILLDGQTEIVAQGHFYKIRTLDSDRMDPFFLFWAMTKAHPSILGKAHVQSTISSVTKDRMLNISIPYPSQETQENIARRMKKLLELRRKCIVEFDGIKFCDMVVN